MYSPQSTAVMFYGGCPHRISTKMFPISSCKTFLWGRNESNLFLPLSLSLLVSSFTISLPFSAPPPLFFFSQERRLHFRVRRLLRQAEVGWQWQPRGEHRRVPAARWHRHHLPRSPRGAVSPGHTGGHRSRGEWYEPSEGSVWGVRGRSGKWEMLVQLVRVTKNKLGKELSRRRGYPRKRNVNNHMYNMSKLKLLPAVYYFF